MTGPKIQTPTIHSCIAAKTKEQLLSAFDEGMAGVDRIFGNIKLLEEIAAERKDLNISSAKVEIFRNISPIKGAIESMRAMIDKMRTCE